MVVFSSLSKCTSAALKVAASLKHFDMIVVRRFTCRNGVDPTPPTTHSHTYTATTPLRNHNHEPLQF